MDEDTKTIACDYIARGQPHKCFPPTSKGIGTLTIDASPVCSKTQHSLYSHILYKKFVTKLAKDWGMDPEVLSTHANWPAFAKARKAVPFALNKFISKWLSNDLPTGHNMKCC